MPKALETAAPQWGPPVSRQMMGRDGRGGGELGGMEHSFLPLRHKSCGPGRSLLPLLEGKADSLQGAGEAVAGAGRRFCWDQYGATSLNWAVCRLPVGGHFSYTHPDTQPPSQACPASAQAVTVPWLPWHPGPPSIPALVRHSCTHPVIHSFLPAFVHSSC